MANLLFYYSAMNAGKSALLLQQAHNLESKGFKVKRWTSALDSREGQGKIHSRVGISAKAEPFAANTQLYRKDCGWDYIFVDEAQFLTKKQVLDLCRLVDDHHVTCFCYGLRTDFRGEPFEGATYLMAWADEVREIPSYDSNGNKAQMNIRVDKAGNRVWHGTQVQIGYMYESIHRQDFDLVRALRTGLAG